LLILILQTHTSLFAMAVSAKGLPVVFVPEKDRIAAMRNNVVYYGCRGKFSVLPTLNAQRMLAQESCSGVSPFAAVSAFSRASAQTIS
ncbi:MAG: hypothetical protein U0L09_08365, partial [Christensenellales bacterium]|nr:hypothetical protein [Christensenellales bacterium]